MEDHARSDERQQLQQDQELVQRQIAKALDKILRSPNLNRSSGQVKATESHAGAQGPDELKQLRVRLSKLEVDYQDALTKGEEAKGRAKASEDREVQSEALLTRARTDRASFAAKLERMEIEANIIRQALQTKDSEIRDIQQRTKSEIQQAQSKLQVKDAAIDDLQRSLLSARTMRGELQVEHEHDIVELRNDAQKKFDNLKKLLEAVDSEASRWKERSRALELEKELSLRETLRMEGTIKTLHHRDVMLNDFITKMQTQLVGKEDALYVPWKHVSYEDMLLQMDNLRLEVRMWARKWACVEFDSVLHSAEHDDGFNRELLLILVRSEKSWSAFESFLGPSGRRRRRGPAILLEAMLANLLGHLFFGRQFFGFEQAQVFEGISAQLEKEYGQQQANSWRAMTRRCFNDPESGYLSVPLGTFTTSEFDKLATGFCNIPARPLLGFTSTSPEAEKKQCQEKLYGILFDAAKLASCVWAQPATVKSMDLSSFILKGVTFDVKSPIMRAHPFVGIEEEEEGDDPTHNGREIICVTWPAIVLFDDPNNLDLVDGKYRILSTATVALGPQKRETKVKTQEAPKTQNKPVSNIKKFLDRHKGRSDNHIIGGGSPQALTQNVNHNITYNPNHWRSESKGSVPGVD